MRARRRRLADVPLRRRRAQLHEPGRRRVEPGDQVRRRAPTPARGGRCSTSSARSSDVLSAWISPSRPIRRTRRVSATPCAGPRRRGRPPARRRRAAARRAARSASVTCSRTPRSAARTATHREMNGSCSPASASSWGRIPRTDASGPSRARMTSATVIVVGRPGQHPAALAAAVALQDQPVAQRPQDVVEEAGRQVVGGRQHGPADRLAGRLLPHARQGRRDADAVDDLVRDAHLRDRTEARAMIGPMARTGSQSVERALAVVRCLAASDEDLGVTDVAARTALSVSTAHRLLQALRADGLVAQDPRTERYHLGPGLVALGRRAEARLPFDHLVPAARGARRRRPASRSASAPASATRCSSCCTSTRRSRCGSTSRRARSSRSTRRRSARRCSPSPPTRRPRSPTSPSSGRSPRRR